MTKNNTKTVVGLIASFSSSVTVGLALRTILPPQLNLLQKVCSEIGIFAIGGLVGSKAEDYARDLVDDTYAIFNQ